MSYICNKCETIHYIKHKIYKTHHKHRNSDIELSNSDIWRFKMIQSFKRYKMKEHIKSSKRSEK